MSLNLLSPRVLNPYYTPKALNLKAGNSEAYTTSSRIPQLFFRIANFMSSIFIYKMRYPTTRVGYIGLGPKALNCK